MSDVLKGNFKPKNPVTTREGGPESLEERFEREALKRLGGSIAFVSRKRVMWDAKEKDAPATPDATNGIEPDQG